MAVTVERVEELIATAERSLGEGVPRSRLERVLRDAAPDLRITVCSEDDVVHKPFRERPTFDAHLIGGGDHCLSITGDPEAAIGVVFAMREEGA